LVYFDSIMKTKLLFIRNLFTVLSVVAPAIAAQLAFRLFQTTRKKTMTEKERSFYQNAERFIICHEKEDIIAYRLGNPLGKLVFLVHGWESNAGSMAAIAYSMVQQGFNVIAFDLPAHGHSRLKRTNLLESSHVFKTILDYFNPMEFSVISHSFGSAVTSYTLSHSKHIPKQLVFLTSPNQILDIFEDFRDLIGLGSNAYRLFLKRIQSIIPEPLSEVTVLNMNKTIGYQDLLLIHDRYDKIIPFAYSQRMLENLDNTYLEPFEKIGHYRMLWNPNVVIKILSHWQNNLLLDRSVA